MRAISVTLPEILAQRTESLVIEGEYVSRSEVLRTALRLLFALGKEAPPELVQFSKRPLGEIEEGLSSAGHKPEFVQSVVAGLKKSSIYKKGL